MTDGFLLTRQWIRNDLGGQDLVFWVATDEGPLRVVACNQTSVCFVREKDATRLAGMSGLEMAKVALQTFDHEPVMACYFDQQPMLTQARSRLREGRLLEADVRPPDRFLMERFVTAGMSINGTIHAREGYREVVDPIIRPAEYRPSLRVASLDIETSWNENIVYSIAIHCGDEKRVFMEGTERSKDSWLEFVNGEKALIERFLAWFAELDPDVIIGWNVVGFDLHFLERRCESLGIVFALGRAGQPVVWRSAASGVMRHFALVPGRVVLDGIETLRAATWSFESFSLEAVSRELLGRGKLIADVDARATEIQTLFRTDKRQLAAYNLEDCVLVSDIFETTELMAFAIERAHLTGLEMDRPGGSVAAFDFLYLPRLHRCGYVAPVVTSSDGAGGPGGYVLDSKPGLFEHVIVLDFKSLYPSIIRTFHVDPLALVVGGGEVDAIDGFLGARFSRQHVILPALIESLWAARDRARRAGNAPLSQAIKIIMNSFYGVLGTPGCRFFDPRLVSSITLRGHEILMQTRDLIEARGFPVIYGDTDSVFVLLEGVAGDAVDAEGQALADMLNAWWREHLAQKFDIESCLEVEFETHYERFLMPRIRGAETGSKKRYAGLRRRDGAPDLVFKGLESVRSDWSRLARDFQRELYRRVFLDEPFEQFVLDTVAKVRAGERDDALVLRRRLRRGLDEYTKNVPPHVRAARRAEEIRNERGLGVRHQRGGWVEYVMTVSGPEPLAYLSSAIDYDFYIERQLAPIADAILSLKGTSLAALTDRQLGLF